MAVRPYPDSDRARHQLDRHTQAPRTVTGLEALRGWSVNSADATRRLATRFGEASERLRSAQPDGRQAMANIAAALGRMPSTVRAPAASDPGSGT
jgi:hypothetical protein